MKRLLHALSVLVLTIVGALVALNASTAPAQAAAWACDSGDVCFYSGSNGTGQVCSWDIQDPDTRRDSMRCSWMIDGVTPRSVFNRGTSPRFTGVVYYLRTEYRDRVGCTRQGSRGNLTGTYDVLSLRWTTGACG